MWEPKSGVSNRVLSFLEGERLRVILSDGSIAEGVVSRVDPNALHLGSESVPLRQIVTYFILRAG